MTLSRIILVERLEIICDMRNNELNGIELSSLSHTWILDLDGTIVKHNGYKIDGYDTLLEGTKSFIDSIPDDDMIIFLTARKKEVKKDTEDFLKRNGIRYNHIIFEVPHGERILMNDNKPSGLKMAMVYNKHRDTSEFPQIKIKLEL